MNWDDVRVFLAVAQRQNLARGAREAAVDRSTASRRIAALEKSLGAKLFLRTREGLRLSPAGSRLLTHAERMASEARALAIDASDAGSEIVGTVRIATTEALAVLLVEDGILSSRERHPRLVIELLGGNRPVDLVRGEADLALRMTSVHEANVKVRRVARLGLALFASDAYVQRRGVPSEPRALAGHDVLLHGGELTVLPEAKWLASQPGVRVALRTSSMPALFAATLAGAGIAALTDSWGSRTPGLRRLFALDSIPPRALWLAIAPESASRAAVRFVAEHVAARFA